MIPTECDGGSGSPQVEEKKHEEGHCIQNEAEHCPQQHEPRGGTCAQSAMMLFILAMQQIA
eukprot:1289560-Amphidinium_carterae.1